MIGGYVYRERDVEMQSRLERRLDDSQPRIPVWDKGYLFHDRPFSDDRTSRLISDDTIVLSQDILVTAQADGEYRRLDLRADFAERLSRDATAAFDAIASDYRMAVVRRRGPEKTLFLVSNRAGSGRIYYHTTKSGLVFCSG